MTSTWRRFQAWAGALLLGAALLCWVAVLLQTAPRQADQFAHSASGEAPDSFYIAFLLAIVLTPLAATLGPWLLGAAVTMRIPRAILRSASMAVIFAPAATIVTSPTREARLVLSPFWMAFLASSLDEKLLAGAQFLCLLGFWALLAILAATLARSRPSETAMTVLALSAPCIPLVALLPCLFVPALSPLVWAGEATVGWCLFLLVLTRRSSMSSPVRLWALRGWLLLGSAIGAAVMVVAFFGLAAWSAHIT
jgi:hypothetical protein